MTTINAHKLQRLIKQTRPHISVDDIFPPINGIRFECDGVHIHALATDRYTFAAARTKVREETDTWTVTVSESNLGWLTAWLEAHEGDTILDLAAGTDGLTITNDHGKLVVPGKDHPTFPKWQHLFRDTLQDASAAGDLVSVDTTFLARWKDADSHLRVWHTAPEKPLLLVGEDFLGLQMPARYTGDTKDRPAVLSAWSGSLDKGGEPAEIVALPEPGAVAEMAESMLRQTLRSTSEMFGADMDTETGRGAFNAWVHSGIYAWSAYRILQALKKADPDLAETTVRDLNEQLESGEIGEWAWDEAEQAGHDPKAWHDDYETHKQKLAEERKAAETAAPEVADAAAEVTA